MLETQANNIRVQPHVIILLNIPNYLLWKYNESDELLIRHMYDKLIENVKPTVI